MGSLDACVKTGSGHQVRRWRDSKTHGDRDSFRLVVMFDLDLPHMRPRGSLEDPHISPPETHAVVPYVRAAVEILAHHDALKGRQESAFYQESGRKQFSTKWLTVPKWIDNPFDVSSLTPESVQTPLSIPGLGQHQLNGTT